jgi:hypothetical protein
MEDALDGIFDEDVPAGITVVAGNVKGVSPPANPTLQLIIRCDLLTFSWMRTRKGVQIRNFLGRQECYCKPHLVAGRV